MPSLAKVERLFCTFVIAIALNGCRSVSAPELFGEYRLQANWGCGSLVLNRGHTFKQEVSLNCKSPSNVLDGVWSVSGDPVHEITLKPFWDYDSNNSLRRFEYDKLPIERATWGPIRLVTNPDAGFSYEKK